MTTGGGGFVVAWEFRVRAEAVAAFVQAYGPEGAWAALFRRAEGFVETLLLADRTAPGRFVTVDRWRDAAAHRAFHARFTAEYAALDTACAGWTTHEAWLGEFDVAAPPAEEIA